jgi:hypothetical protein
MIYTNSNSSFPSQVVPDEEKQSLEYGTLVGQAIEYEWFNGNSGTGGANGRWNNNWQRYHNLRLYARGEQSVQKYKDEMAINGDLSYLNIDWKPVPVIPKFVDIVVNGISSRNYKVKTVAQDPASVSAKTKYTQALTNDMQARELLAQLKSKLGADLYQSANPDLLPEDDEQLALHMQLSYKQAVEIAEQVLHHWGKSPDPTVGAVMYHATWMDQRPFWAESYTRVVRIDNHVFYK